MTEIACEEFGRASSVVVRGGSAGVGIEMWEDGKLVLLTIVDVLNSLYIVLLVVGGLMLVVVEGSIGSVGGTKVQINSLQVLCNDNTGTHTLLHLQPLLAHIHLFQFSNVLSSKHTHSLTHAQLTDCCR